MGFVLGIDLGTSYFKAGIFDRSGKLRGLGRVAVEKDSPKPDTCELPVDRFWNIIKEAIGMATHEAAVSLQDIKAVGYSSQANSFLLLDENDSPLTPLVLWPDLRAERVYEQVEQLWLKQDFSNTTGIGIGVGRGYMVNKLLWYKNEMPDVWSKTRKVKSISDYLIFGLTETDHADLGTASLLGLLDIHNRTWWSDACNTLGVDENKLSKLVATGSAVGVITDEGQKLTGLPAGIPLVAGSLDHYVAAIGVGVGTRAQMSESTGTVLACVNVVDHFKQQPDICIGNALDESSFFQLSFDNNGAVSLEWYKKLFASEYSIKELVEMASKTESTSGLTALPRAYTYDGIEAFKGVTKEHQHGHFIRAIMQSVAETLNGLVRKLADDQMPDMVVSTGGGAKSDYWLSLKSKLAGTPFAASNCDEPACRGAAMLAAAETDWFCSIEKVSESWLGA